jgi:hypothetical protein
MNTNEKNQVNQEIGTYKSEIYYLYRKYSMRVVRKKMNEIIMDSRMITHKQATRVRTLYNSEVQALLEEFI